MLILSGSIRTSAITHLFMSKDRHTWPYKMDTTIVFVFTLWKNDLKVVPFFGQVVNYQRFHNLERRTMRLGCSFCGRIFVTKEELKNHKLNKHKLL